jgi:transposase
MFSAIIDVLRIGIQWNALPQELGASSTVCDCFRWCEKQGFFHRLWQAGLADPKTSWEALTVAWYGRQQRVKALPTFADTLAFVRQQLWPVTLFGMSPAKSDMVEIPRALFERLIDTLAFVA